MWWSQRGHKRRHNMAHARSMLEKHSHAHAHASGHPHPQAQKGERARARAHTHTDKYIILIAFPWQQWLANAPQCYVLRTLRVLYSTYKQVKSILYYHEIMRYIDTLNRYVSNIFPPIQYAFIDYQLTSFTKHYMQLAKWRSVTHEPYNRHHQYVAESRISHAERSNAHERRLRASDGSKWNVLAGDATIWGLLT
jgi:hypothetical protein